MAIYHLTAKPLSRSRRNTVKAAAYRAGCQLRDMRTGETFDYRHRTVGDVDLLLPEGAPLWAEQLQQAIREDRETGVQAFVDLVEAAEKRCDARVYREVEFALPRELTDEQGIALAKSFVRRSICTQGIGVLTNFHLDVDEETGARKPHFHTLLLTRRLTEDGLDPKKERAWDHVDFLSALRADWTDEANAALKAHGHDVRIDHRSYAEQGLTLEPQPKLSRKTRELERKGEKEKQPESKTHLPLSAASTKRAATFEQVKLRNLYRIISRPELVFDIVTRQYTTFMWGDVQRVLARYVDDASLFQRLEVRLRASKERVQLHASEDESKHIYTTRTLLKTEKRLLQTVDALVKAHSSHAIAADALSTFFEKAKEELKEKHNALLSDEQEAFVRYVTSPGRLKCGTGYAGTGKTTALLACQSIWESAGYKVYGLTPTGRAASLLSQKGLPAMTVDKFLRNYQGGRCQYHTNSILVLDEAGMVDVRRMDALMHAAGRLGVKLVCIGDEGQLKPIEAGDAFKLIRKEVPETALLSQVVRQKIDWQKDATLLFGNLRTSDALSLYLKHGLVRFVKEEKEASLHEALLHASRQPPIQDLRVSTRAALLKAWEASIDVHDGPQNHLILSFFRHDVGELNRGAREILKAKGLIKGREFVHTIASEDEDDFGHTWHAYETKSFAVGDRIVFLRNDTGLGVQNGCLGTVVKATKNNLSVQLDDEAAGSISKVVSFAPKLYPWFDHGWALTVHKAQGMSVAHVFVLVSSWFSRNLSYVALSRHCESVHIFASLAEFPSVRVFLEKLSRAREKLTARDYLSADQVESLMHQDEDLLMRVLRPLRERLEAMGYVSKRAVQQVAEKVLGLKVSDYNRDLSPFVRPSLSEERRAERLLNPESKRTEKGYSSATFASRQSQKPQQPFYDREEVLRSLGASTVESLFQSHVHQWVERPVMRRYGDEIRYGTKGGFVVNPARGQWYDHYSGKGGDLFHYLSESRGLSYAEAIRDVATSAGLSGSYPVLKDTQDVQKRWAAAEVEKQQEREKKRQEGRAKAEALFKETKPLTGTHAEIYLRTHRHILCELLGDIRYNPARPTAEGPHPALIAFARQKDGSLSGFQEIFLDQETGAKAQLKLVKKSGGAIKGASVKIQEDIHGRSVTFIAEGLETALSVKAADLPGEILCGLGRANFKALEPESKTIVLCADWDGEGAKTHEALLKDQEYLQSKGYTVHIIWPTQKGHEKRDFNDILKKEGSGSVRALFEAQVPELCSPHHSLEEAKAACHAFFFQEPYASWSAKGKATLSSRAEENPFALLREFKEEATQDAFHAHHEALGECTALLQHEAFAHYSIRFHERARQIAQENPHGVREELQEDIRQFEQQQRERGGQAQALHPMPQQEKHAHVEMVHGFEWER